MPHKSFAFTTIAALAALAAFAATPAMANNWDQTLRGKIWQYTAGTGITSSTPQVQTWTAFCASGAFHMYGKSCVRNRIASGYRCSDFRYFGGWQVQDQGQFAVVNWQTNGGRGSYRIDARGNQLFLNGRPLKIFGPANC